MGSTKRIPTNVSVPGEMAYLLSSAGIGCSYVDSTADLVRRADVISMIPFELPDFHVTRATQKRADDLPARFRLSRQLLEGPGRDVIVLHTGPRGAELPPEVDELPNVKYFDGVRSGVYLRAALLTAVTQMAQPAAGHQSWGRDTAQDDR